MDWISDSACCNSFMLCPHDTSPLKRVAKIGRARQSEAPRPVDCLGNSNPWPAHDSGLRRPRRQSEWPAVDAFAVQLVADGQGLSEAARSRAQQPRILLVAPFHHL